MEIETRAKVEDLSEIKKRLLELGAEFTNTEKQDDSFFKPKGREMEAQEPGSHILRIRKEKEAAFLNMKELTETSGVWNEYETKLGDSEETRKIVEKMGYVHVFDINKTRGKGKIGEINLCLDDVKQLGKYIELEIIGEDVADAKQRMLALLKQLGVDESKIEHRGYARMISENMGIRFKGVK